MKTTGMYVNPITLPANIEVEARRELIDELGNFAAYNQNVLGDIHLTFEQSEADLDLVYGLDFDVIYAYANPWSRDAEHASLVRYIIEEDNIPLTLLPGTVEELFVFMKHAKQQQIEATSLVKSLQSGNATSQTIESGISLCDRNELGEYGSSQKVDHHELCLRLMECAERYTTATARIESVLESGRLVTLQSLYRDSDEPFFDEAFAKHYFAKLTAYRGGSKFKWQNEADAKNIATILKYADIESKVFEQNPDGYHGRVLRLLTNTHCLLDMKIEEFNDKVIHAVSKPLKGALQAISHSLAVRSCFEAAYAAAMANSYNYDKTLCRQKSHEQFERARLFELAVERLDEHDRDCRVKRLQETKRIKKVVDEFIPGFAQEFVKDNWYQTVKQLMCVDAREQESKKWVDRSDETWWVPLTDFIPELTKQKLLAIQRSDITKLDFIYGKKKPKDILSAFGIIAKDIPRGSEDAPKRWSIANMFVATGQEILTLDQNNGVIYLSWPCGLTEPQIIDIINEMFISDNGTLVARCGQGVLCFVYGGEGEIVEVCKLPLTEKITRKTYSQWLESVELESGVQLRRLVPSEFRCDTPALYIKFELTAENIDAGIMFAYENIELTDIVLQVFEQTSSWADEWLYARQLKDFIRSRIMEKVAL